MHTAGLQSCSAIFSGLQGRHCVAKSLAVQTAAQTHTPLQLRRVDGSFEQQLVLRPEAVRKKYQRASASFGQKSSRRSIADRTLPVTPEVPNLPCLGFQQ